MSYKEQQNCDVTTLCPPYWDSPVNGDPTSVHDNETPCYPDKKAKCFFCPDNKCPVNED